MTNVEKTVNVFHEENILTMHYNKQFQESSKQHDYCYAITSTNDLYKKLLTVYSLLIYSKELIMAKRFDPIVKYEGRDYNVLEIPENNTALVKEHEDLVLASADLESLVRDLSLVGKFIRIAYNGVAGYTDLQIKVRRVGINVSKLCNESTNLVWQFKLKSRTVLEDLQSTYQFLSDGMEDIALGVLQSTATEAQGMAEAAKKLAQAFEEESGRVEDAHEDTLKTKAAEKKRKDDLDEEKKRAEIEKARAVTENTGVEQDLAFQEQQYARADARYAIESRDDGFFDAIHNFFTGRKDERIRVARQDMERHLQEISDLRKSRSKLLQDIAEFSKKMENCQEESVLTEAAIKSLHSAIGGLKGLSNIMRKIADFWKKLETHCKELGGEKMRKLMEVAMKRPKEERAEVWGTDAFKMQAMHYYARWVALGNICGVAYERMKVTQSELYEYLEENLTTEEARRNVRKLAATFSKELEMAIEENKTQEQREKTALSK